MFLHRSPRILAAILTATCPAQPPAAASDQSAKITGHVNLQFLDEHGRPVPGVELAFTTPEELDHGSPRLRRFATSNRRGRIDCSYQLPAGTRTVLIARRGGYATTRVPAAGALRTGLVLMTRASFLSGVVRDARGKPIADARITGTDVMKRRPGLRGRRGSAPHSICWTRTDATGRFRMPDAARAGVLLTVRKAGYYSSPPRFVHRWTPAEVRLHRAAELRGRVTDAAGKPADAVVWARYELGTETTRHRTRADGTFAFPLAHPGRYRLVAQPHYLAGSTDWNETEIQDRPRQDLTLKLDHEAGPHDPHLLVEVHRRAGGAALPGALALVRWKRRGAGLDLHGLARQPAQLRAARNDGVVLLQPPGRKRSDRGQVLVMARGFAPRVFPFDYRLGEANRIRVHLDPEPSLAGTVIDAATEQPIPGASLWLHEVRELLVNGRRQRASTWPRVVHAGSDGAFRIDQLWAGRFQVHARAPGYLDSRAREFQLRPGQRATKQRFALRRGAQAIGRIRALPKAPACWVRLIHPRGPAPSSLEPLAQRVAAPDGAFAVPGLATATYHGFLFAPTGGLGSGLVRMPLAAFVVAGRQGCAAPFHLRRRRLGRGPRQGRVHRHRAAQG